MEVVPALKLVDAEFEPQGKPVLLVLPSGGTIGFKDGRWFEYLGS